MTTEIKNISQIGPKKTKTTVINILAWVVDLIEQEINDPALCLEIKNAFLNLQAAIEKTMIQTKGNKND